MAAAAHRRALPLRPILDPGQVVLQPEPRQRGEDGTERHARLLLTCPPVLMAFARARCERARGMPLNLHGSVSRWQERGQ